MLSVLITDITKCAGTERAVSSVVNYLADHDFELEIISLCSKSGKPFFDLNNKVRCIHLGVPSYEHGTIFAKLKGYVLSFKIVYTFFRVHKTDLVLGTSRNTNVLSVLCCRNEQSKVIGCEHFQYGACSLPIRLIRNFFYEKLDKLVVLTDRDKNKYRKHNINTICIPNAVPFDIQHCENSKEKIAIAVGRHSREKNFAQLLKLWRKANIEDWKLQIIGEGPLVNENKKIAKQLELHNVEFVPFTKNIIDYYRMASLYLMTSQYEAFPMVLLEAKTCGCVCVSFDCETGPREIINDGIDGFLIPVGNDNMFIQQVRKLTGDLDLIKQMGQRSLENSKEYSKEVVLRKWIELLS